MTTLDVVEAHSEEVIGTVPDAGGADVDAAVSAARQAFDRSDWSRAPVTERIAVVQRLIDEFGRRAEEMARTITSENGAPIKFSRLGQVGAPLDIMASMVDLAAATPWEERRSGRYLDYLLRREPVGVVGAVVAWNVPQVLIAIKLAPALLAGCTVVVKAAPEASLDAMLLAEVARGRRPPPGHRVRAHRWHRRRPGPGRPPRGGQGRLHRIDRGRARDRRPVRRRTSAAAASSWAASRRPSCWTTSTWPARPGRSGSPRSSTTARPVRPRPGSWPPGPATPRRSTPSGPWPASLTVGDPHDPARKVGPLVSRRQRDRVRGYIRSGIDDGCPGGHRRRRRHRTDCRRVVRPSHRVRRRRQRDAHRPGGDLRPGTLRHPLRRR